MALVQRVTTAQIQAEIDRFANTFIGLESQAEDLVAFRANIAATGPLLVGDDGQPMAEAVRAELYARLGALQTFVTWATTGNPSPLAYLRGVKRAV